MPQPIISARNICKSFGSAQVLKDVSLDVYRGEVVVIVGPSGAGKSTFCRSLNGLEPIDSGQIFIDGEVLPEEGRALTRLRAEVGMVFQSFNLFSHLNLLDNVTLGPRKVLSLGRKRAESEAIEALTRVRMEAHISKFPRQLSGGQQQRAAIARALAMKPKAMLFDEPTSALDPELIREVLDVMRELANGGMTMLVVTHELNFARQFADRVVFMADGRVIETGSATEIFDNPVEARTRQFLSTVLD